MASSHWPLADLRLQTPELELRWPSLADLAPQQLTSPRRRTTTPLPWQAGSMTDGKPEPTPAERVTAAMDEFMATVLRHLRTGQGSPLEELGLAKSQEELQHWRPDVPGAGTEPEHA